MVNMIPFRVKIIEAERLEEKDELTGFLIDNIFNWKDPLGHGTKVKWERYDEDKAGVYGKDWWVVGKEGDWFFLARKGETLKRWPWFLCEVLEIPTEEKEKNNGDKSS
jgi:hypothetical protein